MLVRSRTVHCEHHAAQPAPWLEVTDTATSRRYRGPTATGIALRCARDVSKTNRKCPSGGCAGGHVSVADLSLRKFPTLHAPNGRLRFVQLSTVMYRIQVRELLLWQGSRTRVRYGELVIRYRTTIRYVTFLLVSK